MKKLLFLFSLLSLPAYAGTSSLDVVTISRTLTLTSPSAVISMTGVSSTANLRTVVASTVSSTSYIGRAIPKAWAKMDGNSCSVTAGFNVSSCTRVSAGVYGVSFTTPMADANYIVNCMARGSAIANVATGFSQASGNASPTASGFNFAVYATSSGSPLDSGDIQCIVIGN